MVTVATVIVALLLAAAPARAQEADAPDSDETPKPTGAEAGNDSPTIGGGSMETSDGSRFIKVGDNCVLIEDDEGGEDLAVGSCDEGDAGDQSGGDDASDDFRRNKDRTAPQNITDHTVTEEMISEGTAGATDFEESTASEGMVQEEPEDNSGAGAECSTAPEGETLEATVERTVDGDTLELAEPVEGVSRVRLIGVDAPELKGEGGESEPHAEEAGFTASELESERVLLELDEETTDPDGWLLAYVWREQEPSRLKRSVPGGGESELFNQTLLKEGSATAMPVEPNTRYAGCFDEAERAAREKGNGLWDVSDRPDDERYEETTVPEGTEPEFTTPEADEPERALPEKTNAGGRVEEEEASPSFDSLPIATDRPEQTLLEATGSTERTTPDLPEGNGEEAAEAPHDRYDEPEERTVPEDASTEAPASEGSVSPADEDDSGPDVEAKLIQEPAVTGPERPLLEERTVEAPSEEELPGSPSETAKRTERTLPEATETTERAPSSRPKETSEETAEVTYDRYKESEERILDGATVPETNPTPFAPEGGSGIEVETEPVTQPAAKPPAESVPALPTRQTPHGPAPVLPETGGGAFLPLILGMASLAVGVLSLGLLRRGERRGGVRLDER
ncbi:MAG: thermonuclease family protein [Actinomycetota bacterium]|nr:thermonuclease family protein [Actinomycetota bacterium]